MNAIIIAALVLAVVGIVVGIALVYIGEKFRVEVDERETAVREVLPGNNCGACGYAGCDAVASAIVSGEAPASVCPVGGAPVTAKINEIMGTSAAAAERKVALVRCNGNCENTSAENNYVGIQDCRAAALAGLHPWSCDYGCMGYGSCVNVCPQNAIHVINGVAVVDKEACIGCGLCVKECPKKLIELVPYSQKTFVLCSNKDKGKDVKAVCKVGCIACRICTKQCQSEAITVDDNLAHINYETCKDCGKCAEKCPQHIITR
ncbi:MAG: RnfABCDGE type electron transport complex subunit B [Lachnospiraceae bacterium]|nr:RnfABCDGE type electron transport complex subunit B [Lachnospiraceae bacterium]